MTANGAFCDSDDISYTMSFTPVQLGSNFINYDTITGSVNWDTSEIINADTYTITVTGTTTTRNDGTSFSATTVFDLVVSAAALSCSDSTDGPLVVVKGADLAAQTFIVDDTSNGSVTINEFTESGSDSCEPSDIVYTHTVTRAGGGDTSFITFDDSTRVVDWSSATNTNAATYTITVTGTITRNDGSTSSATSVV